MWNVIFPVIWDVIFLVIWNVICIASQGKSREKNTGKSREKSRREIKKTNPWNKLEFDHIFNGFGIRSQGHDATI